MANLDELPKGMAKVLVDQIGGLAARLPAPAPTPKVAGAPKTAAGAKVKKAAAPKFKESFAVCTATLDHVLRPPADLAAVAELTGRWHHLIRAGKQIVQFARSSEAKGFDGKGTAKVTQMGPVDAAHAAAVDAAIAAVEADFKTADSVVRWLEIPAYYVAALLVVTGKKMHAVVVSQPPSFTQVQPAKSYEFKEFLEKLSREQHT